jgi:hypothetical protein
MAKRLFDTYSEAEQIKTLYRAINHVLDNENIKDIDEVYKSDFMLIHNMPIHQIILKVKEKK